MSEDIDIDSMAVEILGVFQTDRTDYGYSDMLTASEDLVKLIRAVVREELTKLAERQEAAHRLAVSDMWNSARFQQQVDDLRQGPTLLMGGGDCQGWCCGGKDDVNPDH